MRSHLSSRRSIQEEEKRWGRRGDAKMHRAQSGISSGHDRTSTTHGMGPLRRLTHTSTGTVLIALVYRNPSFFLFFSFLFLLFLAFPFFLFFPLLTRVHVFLPMRLTWFTWRSVPSTVRSRGGWWASIVEVPERGMHLIC